jgi:hypothetical protein
MSGPSRLYTEYRAWLTLNDAERAKNKWMSKRFEKGFTVKCLWKSFINSVHKTRVMKLTNVEDIFTDPEDIKEYQEAKEVMIKLNLVKE